MDNPSDGLIDEHDVAATDQDWDDFEKFLRKKKKNEKPNTQMAFYPFPLQEEEYQGTLVSIYQLCQLLINKFHLMR